MKKMLLACVLTAAFTTNAIAGKIVVATSDYETGNTAILDSRTGDFLPNAYGQNDQDLAVFTRGNYIFFLEKTNGALAKYDYDGLLKKKPVYQYSVGAGTNPQDIVFISDTKAYIVRYGSGSLLIVDPSAASAGDFVKGEIDISMFDTVGVPEAIAGACYDGAAYIVMQRLNGWTADRQGLIVTIDTATDTIIDADTATPGLQGKELLVKNPQFFSLCGSRFYIGGHVWGETTQGVEVFYCKPWDGKPEQEMILQETKLGVEITGMKVFNENYGIYYSSMWVQDSQKNWLQVGKAFWFRPDDGTPGAVLPVPDPEGGAVWTETMLYIGSRNSEKPGIYKVDPYLNRISGSAFFTTLPPIAMAYLGEPDPIAVDDERAVPAAFSLGNPSPNPFNPATTITVTIDRPGHITVDVYAINGQHIATLANSVMTAGVHRLIWDGAHAPSGVYIIKASCDGVSKTAKATLIK